MTLSRLYYVTTFCVSKSCFCLLFPLSWLCRFRVETVTHDGPSVCQQSFGLVSDKQRIYLLSFLAVIFMLIKKDIWNSGNKVVVVGIVVWLLVENRQTTLFNNKGFNFIAKYVLIPSFKKS